LFIIPTCLAILICHEHSFWLTQQGSSPTKGFTEAFDIYLADKRVLLDQSLEDYLALKGNNDWLTTKYSATRNECAEFRKIVLDNLLRKAGPCLFQAWVADMILQPVLNPPFDIRICTSDVFLAQSELINKMLRFCTATTNLNFIMLFLAILNSWRLMFSLYFN